METHQDGVLHLFDEEREIVVRAASGVDPLIEALTRGVTPDITVLDALETLEGLGAVMLRSASCVRESRQSRQLEYFDAWGDEARSLQSRIEASRLLILGLGGTGTEFLRHMVAVGVRDFVLVDQDVVEESNFNRQTIYTYSDLGRAKVDAAEGYVRERLRSPRCVVIRAAVRADERFAALVLSSRPSLVFVAVDEPAETISKDLASVLDGLAVPYLIAGVGVRHGQVLPVGTAPDPAVPIIATGASLATTNAMVAARAAHRAVEFLTQARFPFEVDDVASA